MAIFLNDFIVLLKTLIKYKMKTKHINLGKTSLVFLMLVFVSKIAVSQIDTTAAAKPDTTAPKEEKKKSSGFIAYGGVTFNQMNMSSQAQYESNSKTGWALGIAYRRGKFFYWQVGARFNNAIYGVKDTSVTQIGSGNSLTVTDIDIPINVGLNLLSVTGKLLGLRVYLGAVPAFVTGVSNDNNSTLNKNNSNGFNFYGQGGIGVDVLFLSIDAGYNYGFSDVFTNIESKPGQIFVNLGFRF